MLGFEGIVSNGVGIPPDTHMAVGTGSGSASRIVEVTNEGIQIFDKTGASVAGQITLEAFTGATDLAFDPKVIFDQFSGRFFVVVLEVNPNFLTSRSVVHIAVSTSGAPGNLTSNWTKLSGSAVTNISGVNTWFDYPGIGADANSLVLTGNMFTEAGQALGTLIRVFKKSQLLGGTYGFIDIVDTDSSTTLQPAHVYGSTDNGNFYLVTLVDSTTYRVVEITGAPNSPTVLGSDTLGSQQGTWSVGTILSGSGAPQSGTSVTLDTVSPRVMNAVYRSGHIYCTLTCDGDNDGDSDVFWAKIATTSGVTNGGTNLADSGFVKGSTSGAWTFMPSININSRGEILVCYTQSSSSQFPDMRYVFRNPSDASGFFQEPVVAKSSNGFYDSFASNSSDDRWGDYSACVVDPDDQSFWVANEFAKTSQPGNSLWGTFIAHTSTLAAPTNLTATSPSSSTARLNWTDNSNNETGFKIERKSGSGSFSQIGTVGANATIFQDTGLQSQTTFTYRVRATSTTLGDSGYSNEASVTTNFSISGTVTDENGDLSGVTVTAAGSSTTRSATTGANGTYSITNLPSETYTITPSKLTYSFTPTSRTVNLTTDATNQDFQGTTGISIAFQSATSATANENGAHNVTLKLTIAGGGTLSQNASVQVIDAGAGTASSGTDYTALGTQTVTFPSGAADGATQNVTLNVSADNLVEGDETVNLRLQNATAPAKLGVQITHTVTITDDDIATVAFQDSTGTKGEADSAHNVAVKLSIPGGGTLTRDVTVVVSDAGNGTATSGADYTAFSNQTLTFSAGSGNNVTQNVPLNVRNDTVIEGDETVKLQLGGVGGPAALGSPSIHTVTITDDEPAAKVAFQATNSATVNESASGHTITLVLNLSGGSALGQAVTAEVTDLGTGTATSGTDYAAFGTQSVTFSEGSSNGATQSVTLNVLADSLDDDDETVNLQVGNVTGPGTASGQTTHTVTITDDDLPAFTVVIAADSITENASNPATTATVSRNTSNNAAELVVTLVSSDPTEAVPASATVTIPANQSSTTFNINAVDDDLLDGTQTVTLTASAAGGFTDGTDTVDVTDHETLTVVVSADSIAENAGNAATTATVTRSTTDDLSNPLIVNLASNDTSEATVAATVTILANQASATFNINAVDDNLLDGTQTVPLTASATGFVSDSDTVDVTDHETLTVVIAAVSIAENAGNAATTATVTRNNTGDLSAILTVNLVSNDITEATVPATVLIPSGQASATFNINAIDDNVFDGTQTVTLTASATGFVSGSDTVDVTDQETLSVTIAALFVREQDSDPATTGTVTRSNTDNASAVSVSLVSSDTTEITVLASVTIPGGQASVIFNVNVEDDDISDGSQQVTLTASATGYADGSGSLTVVDNEIPALSVNVVADSVAENAGINATTGTVSRNTEDLSSALLVNVSSDDTSEAVVPSSVTIPANQTSASFQVDAIDDTLLDGTRTTTITASATGFASGSDFLQVTDYERLSLSIVASSISENGGSTTGTVFRNNTNRASPLAVTLNSSDTSEVTVPNTVTIAANQASASFTITAVNDSLVDGTQTVTLTASEPRYAVSGTSTIDVTDDEAATLTVAIAADSFAENAGNSATTGTVTRNPVNGSDLTVTLQSSDIGEATVPSTVTIPANQASASFSIYAVDDAALDGTQTVTITASATGFANGADTVDVTDDEVASAPDLVISALSANPSSVVQGESATMSLTIQNQGNGAAADSTVQLKIDGAQAATFSASALAAGASASFGFDFTNVGATPNPHVIEVVADFGNGVAESDEANNTRSLNLNVLGKPDLIVDSLTVTPNPVAVGGQVVVRFTIKNQGGSTAGESTAGLFLDGTLQQEFLIGALAVGQTSSEQSTTLSNISAAPNPHTVRAFADHAGPYAFQKVDESNETNNDQQVSLDLNPAPDLVIANLQATVDDVNRQVALSFQVANQGEASSGLRSYVKMEIVQNADGTGQVVEQLLSVDDLGAGQNVSLSGVLTLPSSLGSGNYFARVTADALPANGGRVAESNETNNAFQVGITYTVTAPPATDPDLVVADLQVSSNRSTRKVTLTYRIRNQGTEATGVRSYVKMEITRNSNGTGLLAQGYSTINSLDASADTSITFTLRLSSSVSPGTYFVRVTADALPANGGRVAESNENNNLSQRSFSY